MTQRHMHLSPAAVDAAIRLLDQPSPGWLASGGALVEDATGGALVEK